MTATDRARFFAGEYPPRRTIDDLAESYRHTIVRMVAIIGRLIAHIARLEGTDIATARTKHLGEK